MSIEDIMDKTEARVEHRNAPTQREYINDIEKCSIQKDCQFPMYRLTSLFSRPLIMKVYAGNKKQGGEQGIQLGNLVDDLGQIDGDPDAIPQLIETYDVYNLGLGPTQQVIDSVNDEPDVYILLLLLYSSNSKLKGTQRSSM